MELEQVVLDGRFYPDVVIGMMRGEIQISQGADRDEPVPTYELEGRRNYEFDTISVSLETAVQIARQILKLAGEV